MPAAVNGGSGPSVGPALFSVNAKSPATKFSRRTVRAIASAMR